MNVIQKSFTMDFVKDIEHAMDAGDFAVHPAVLCIPFKGAKLNNASLKDALQSLPGKDSLVWLPLSNRYIPVQNIVAIKTGHCNMDNGIPATATSCHNDDCILPEHICLQSDQTQTCKTGHGDIDGHMWTEESYIPFNCPILSTACRPASAVISPEETTIASWMYYMGHSSLGKVPIDKLLEEEIPDELMDCRLRTYKVHVKVSEDGVENFLKFSHDTSLREHIDARRGTHAWKVASSTELQNANADMNADRDDTAHMFTDDEISTDKPEDNEEFFVRDSEEISSSPFHSVLPTHPALKNESAQYNNSNHSRTAKSSGYYEMPITKDEIDQMITQAKTICPGRKWNRLSRKAKDELREIQVKCL